MPVYQQHVRPPLGQPHRADGRGPDLEAMHEIDGHAEKVDKGNTDSIGVAEDRDNLIGMLP